MRGNDWEFFSCPRGDLGDRTTSLPSYRSGRSLLSKVLQAGFVEEAAGQEDGALGDMVGWGLCLPACLELR